LHRVGRTARGAHSKGKALLILLENEIGLIRYLKKYKININEFEFPDGKLAKIQSQFEKLVEKNYYLYAAANDAYKTYLYAYVSQKLKDVYDINGLDLSKVCCSFGFTSPPYVNLNIKLNISSRKKKKAINMKEKIYNKKENAEDEKGNFFDNN